ncbi:hypothetical protein QBC35DRAFT_134167 [Podospora australis]|uniref:cyclin-dependent kinase n=1 Tax=Podospora australis TaxID=1536484 RepID=A0AAN6WYK8_9PEZI|nr:hypothetical protein QBC35DRAFT_134167 [Podospora australis]
MEDASAGVYQRIDAASSNGNKRYRDSQHHYRRRNEYDLGMNTSRRPSSPAAAAVNRSSAPAREKERERHHHHSRSPPPPPPPPPPPARGRSVEPPEHNSERRRHDRSRSRSHRTGRSSRASQRSPHSRRDRSRDRDRDRDRGNRDSNRARKPRLSPERRRPRSGSPRPRRDTREDQGSHSHRRASRSPGPSKRPRSPSPSLVGGSQPKKSRRDRSPVKVERDAPKSLQSKPRRDPSPLDRDRRPRSPDYPDRRSRPSKRSGRSKSRSPSRRRRSRSRSRGGVDSTALPPPRRRTRSPRRRPRSPRPDQRHRSRSRSRDPSTRGNRPPAPSGTGSHRRPSLEPNSSQPPHRPLPPDDQRGSRLTTTTTTNPSNTEENREESRSSKKFDPSSGSNSIEVSMTGRGGYRGGLHPPHQPRGGYGQSSGNGTPASSMQGSPPAHSPYQGGGRGRNGQQHQSPHGQFNSHQSHNNSNFSPPTAPQSHLQSNQAHSPPHAPTGPAAQFSQGQYRGGHRGGHGAYRGNQFNHGRGGMRPNFKNSSQWNTNSANTGRSPDPSHGSNNHSPAPQDKPSEPNDTPMPDADNAYRPPKELQVEDKTSKEEQPNEDKTANPLLGRAPPTGPQSQTSNKFSFSMKNASKPAVAGPRPEISSKFNAAAAPRDPPPNPLQKAPPTRPERDRSRFPKNAPTEPASARARPIDRRPPPEPRRGPESRREPEPRREAEPRKEPESRRGPEPSRQADPTPRTRRVKKILKRLKEKPKLPPDLAQSKSVYFRKPGNESVVGSGTYGKVFKGLNVYTSKLVALKRIRMEGERDGFPVTAVREIKLLRSLKHKNIVDLQEVMVETNECFMVFEYLSHDLTGLLNHPSYNLEPAHKKHLAQQMFEGLDYLHTRGVLHRDIKAANILVSNEGILKIADFGLARFYEKHRQLEYTNRVITIWYRSPELLLGDTRYGPAVDIWSAACVLVEIFTKRAIFPGDGSEINQLDKIHSVLGTPTTAQWPDLVEMPWFELLRVPYRKVSVFKEQYQDIVTPAAFDLLASMFQFDPAKRPSATEVLQHPYFTTEEPAPRQAIELKDIGGEWHEFESKALRREKEKKEKERVKLANSQANSSNQQQKSEAAEGSSAGRKRPVESVGDPAQREAKRPHLEATASSISTSKPPPPPPPAATGNPGQTSRPPPPPQAPTGPAAQSTERAKGF